MARNGAEPAPVLAVGLGRRLGGKSTGLRELVDRARNQGREVIVADGDARSKTLASMIADAMHPLTEGLPDVKAWLSWALSSPPSGKKPRGSTSARTVLAASA